MSEPFTDTEIEWLQRETAHLIANPPKDGVVWQWTNDAVARAVATILALRAQLAAAEHERDTREGLVVHAARRIGELEAQLAAAEARVAEEREACAMVVDLLADEIDAEAVETLASGCRGLTDNAYVMRNLAKAIRQRADASAERAPRGP